MLTQSQEISRAEFENGTGWEFKPEGACKGDVCIPLAAPPGETINVVQMAQAMGLPVVSSADHGLIAVGPESIGSRALTTARAPDIRLPDLAGNQFLLSSLKGHKVLVYAWAPY